MAAKRQNVLRRRRTIHDIPDDILELTLLRITSIAGVIRTAATCKLWRRVIGDAGFLHRFRRLHGPEILGLYRYYRGCRTFFDPFPTPMIAIDDISDRVSLDFLPARSYSSLMMHLDLHLQDSYRGILAFYRMSCSIIVCCPWTRKHRELYPTTPRGNTNSIFLGIFLLDTDTGLDLNMSNFRVLCVRLIHYYPDDSKTVVASMFSARDEYWIQLGTTAVTDIVPGEIFPSLLMLVGRAGGSICWYSKGTNGVILHLDEGTGEFSRFTLPAKTGLYSYNSWNIRVIGGDTSSVHLVRIISDDLELLRYDRGFGACVVKRKVRVTPQVDNINDKVRQWPPWYILNDVTAEAPDDPGRIVLCHNKCNVEYVWMFSVDTQEIELQRVQKLSRQCGPAFPYELPWSISVCL